MWQKIKGTAAAIACGMALLQSPLSPAWASYHDPAPLAPPTALRLTTTPAVAEAPAPSDARHEEAVRLAPAQRPRDAAYGKAEALARALFLLGSRGENRPFPGIPVD